MKRKEAFLMERKHQEEVGLECKVTIDGYTDFVFLNRDGHVYNQSALNRAIKRIVRDCNDAQFEKSENPKVLLPNFSCHSLRHTFTTRMCEAGTNIKVMQDILGHQDISTTMNIYADVTKELREKELGNLEAIFSMMDSVRCRVRSSQVSGGPNPFYNCKTSWRIIPCKPKCRML